MFLRKKASVLILILLTLSFITTSCSSFNSNVDLTSYNLNEVFTREQAKEDLDFLMDTITSDYFDISDELLKTLNTQYLEEVESFDDKVTRLELWQSLSRINAKLEAGHSSISTNLEYYYTLPYYFDYSNNTLYLDGEYEVVSIGGVDVETLYNNFKELWSYEFEEWAMANFENRLPVREYLALMGVDVTKTVKLVYINADGKKVTEKCVFKAYEYTDDISNHYSTNIKADENYAVYSLMYFPDSSNADFFKTSIDEFFAEVYSNNIENVAIDLRGNTGGSNELTLYILAYLGVKEVPLGETAYPFENYSDLSIPFIYNKYYKADGQHFQGNFYVFTSNKSFSQSSRFVGIVKNLGLGDIIGEVAGGSVNGVCGGNGVTTPNSKLVCVIPNYYAYIDSTPPLEAKIVPDYEVHQRECEETLVSLIE